MKKVFSMVIALAVMFAALALATPTPTPTATIVSSGTKFFQATPTSGKIQLVPSATVLTKRNITSIVIDSLVDTFTPDAENTLRIYDGAILLRSVQISSGDFPIAIDMGGANITQLEIDYGLNTGTSTTVTQ